MGDGHVAFGILTRFFVQHSSYFLLCTPPSSTFIKSFISFDSSFHKMFRCLLGLGSFDSRKRFLARKQTSFPITFGGFGVIVTSTITLTTYLRSWALVVSIIVARFMVDQHHFLLEALAQANNNTFPF